MQIELYVQDVFAESSPNSQFPRPESENYISPQTWQDWVNNWLELLREDLLLSNPTIAIAAHYEMGLRLTDDAEIQQLNAQYRHKNQPTDVLAFATLEDETPRSPEADDDLVLYLGDIVVSVDTAIRQARQQKHSLADELAWLVAHGFLHLLGWDHPDDESLQEMLEQQVRLLSSSGINIDINLVEM